jgi:hydrogenase-4 component B
MGFFYHFSANIFIHCILYHNIMSIFLVSSVFVFALMVALVHEKHKGSVALAAVLVNSLVTSWMAFGTLGGNAYMENIRGGLVFGNIPIRIDGLSAWFILLTNFTVFTGILYGRQYLKKFHGQPANLSLHYISYLINHFALLGIFMVQNGLAFLCIWEIMALTSFVLVIFEHGKMETLKAGMNYLIQSHISILFLTVGFIWVYVHTGSFVFSAIGSYGALENTATGILLFFTFFVGFAIKAGFVPFHTWLPHAHPAAPSHVSGVMSGVIIKTGIYGILRMLLLIHGNPVIVGIVILIISVLTGLYGVMLATVQHNIKKLLAYHSIENIGIIGIGIGLGTLGKGLNSPFLTFAGYAGALLHTFNHSLFKSVLFYASGTVYQATHTLDIEHLGGIIRKMPQTALLFLLSAMAICGLPPFNGFISEFLIYSGLFKAIGASQSLSVIIAISILGLAFIGGLAMLCFTKAFGVIFLGTPRSQYPESLRETSFASLLPQYLASLLIILIGLFPQYFMLLLQAPLQLYSGLALAEGRPELNQIMQKISFSTWGLVLIVLLFYLIRKMAGRHRISNPQPTWGCGYVAPTPKMQYTASSFVRTYTQLIKPMMKSNQAKNEMKEIIPAFSFPGTRFQDKIETGLINWPARKMRAFMGLFNFLQNGRVQFYVLYGVVFIFILIVVPLVTDAIQTLTELLKQL